MRSADCRRYWNDLVDIAEGTSRDAAQAHASVCPACGARLEELRAIISLTKMGAHDAPNRTIAQARAIFVPSKRVIVGALSAIGAGARLSSGESAQFRLSAEDVSVRIMRRREGEAWHVMGMIESSPLPLTVSFAGSELQLREGSFELSADSLDEDLWLEFADRVVRLPIGEKE